MSCNTCQLTKPIPTCTESLVLGTIASDTDVYIFVKNHSSGYIHRQEATSTLYGTLALDMSLPDPSFYNQDSNYEVWVTLQTVSPNDRLDITIDSVTYDCFSLSFYTFYNETDYTISIPEVILEIL